MNWIFSEIRTYFAKLLSLKSEWEAQFFENGPYLFLIEIISEGFQRITSYFDFNLQEASFRYSQFIESIISMAKDRAYYPKRKTGATGYIQVSPVADFDTASYTYTGPNVPYYERTLFKDTNNTVKTFSTETKVFRTGTTLTNTTIDAGLAAVNLGGNKVAIPVTAHGLSSGETLSIKGSDNYDGIYTVLDTSTIDYIHIATSYKAETFIGTEKISSGYLWIPVKEGEPQSRIFISQGTLNEVFFLPGDNIDSSYVKIYKVDSNDNILATVTIIDEFDDLFFQNDLTQLYCKVTNKDDFTGINIEFGDDITTPILTAGDRIKVIYAITNGNNGNILSTGKISEIAQQPIDVSGTRVTFYYRNNYQISGGIDWDTVDSIKRNTNRLFFAGFRPAGGNDYEAIIETHPDVQRAKVWSWVDIGNGTLPVQGTERQNEVFISGVTTYGTTFPPSLEFELQNTYLIDRPKADIIVWQPLNKIGIKFVVTARVDNIVRSVIEANLTTVLNNEYDILNMNFGEGVYESNYIQTIQTTEGILSHTTIAYFVQENEDVQKSAEELLVSYTSSDTSVLEDQILLTNSSFEIWIKRKINGTWYNVKQIASSSGAAITGVGSWSVSGTITYVDNKVSYQLFDILSDIPPAGEPDFGVGGATFGIRNPDDTVDTGYLIYLIYKTEDGNGAKTDDLRLSDFNQILDFNSDLLVFNPEYI